MNNQSRHPVTDPNMQDPSLMKNLNSNYKISKKLLGKGQYGQVLLGYDINKNKYVAIKYVNKKRYKECEQIYRREIQFMTALPKHPNIVQYYGSELINGDLYIFLEYCSMGSLQTIIQNQAVNQIQVMKLFMQVVSAMAKLNQNNKLHRDIKPQNILVTAQKNAKLADFGFAREIDISMTKQRGSPLYFSPQMLYRQPYDQKCDVWSLGMTLYQMLGGNWRNRVIQIWQLEAEMDNFKKGNKLKLPQNLHKVWGQVLDKMIVYDAHKRSSFKQLFTFMQQFICYDKSKKHFNEQYEIYEGDWMFKMIQVSIKITPNHKLIQGWQQDSPHKLVHPNLTKIYHNFINKQKQLVVLCQPFFQGKSRTLHDVIYKENMNYQRIMNIFVQLVDVMCYLQRQGKVHGHLSPKNIFINKDDIIKIDSYDIKNIDSIRKSPIAVFGQLYYAPQILIDQQISPKSDVWSIGLILLQILTGQFILQNDNVIWNIIQKVMELMKNKQKLLKNMPSPWAKILDIMLVWKIQQRASFQKVKQIIKKN